MARPHPWAIASILVRASSSSGGPSRVNERPVLDFRGGDLTRNASICRSGLCFSPTHGHNIFRARRRPSRSPCRRSASCPWQPHACRRGAGGYTSHSGAMDRVASPPGRARRDGAAGRVAGRRRAIDAGASGASSRSRGLTSLHSCDMNVMAKTSANPGLWPTAMTSLSYHTRTPPGNPDPTSMSELACSLQ